MTEEWLRTIDMTYHLNSALKDVWKAVDAELMAIKKGILGPDQLYPPTAANTAFMDVSPAFIVERPTSIGPSQAASFINSNGKRERKPAEEEDEEDEEQVAKLPRRSARLSAPIKRPPVICKAASKIVPDSPDSVEKGLPPLDSSLSRQQSGPPRSGSAPPSEQPEPPRAGSATPSEGPSDTVKSRSRIIEPEMAKVLQEIHELDVGPSSMPIGTPSDYIASQITRACQFPHPSEYEQGKLWEQIDPEFLRVMGTDLLRRGDLSEVPSDTVKSRSRIIEPEMAKVLQEIHELDVGPSSMPIGTPSDYIASQITRACQFPHPLEYKQGELWEKIDPEFLRVMGTDLLRRGDLRRGKFGVLGLVEWILDAREHASWDKTCEAMALQKFIILQDHLKEKVISEGPSDTVKSRSRIIEPEMAKVFQEIHELDVGPSSMPIGTPSDYIASQITRACQFPHPSEYEQGELWEKIDPEFLRVMGTDLLRRGDLRRGKFGVLGIVEWILDAREHASWDKTCKAMALQKFITLQDHLKEKLIHDEVDELPLTILDSPSNSSATLVGRGSSPAPLKHQRDSSLKNVTADDRVDSLDDRLNATVESSSELHGSPVRTKRKKISRFDIVGIYREARSVTPPSDDETGPPASLTPPFDTDKQLQELSKSSKRAKSSRLVNVLVPHISVSSGSKKISRFDIDGIYRESRSVTPPSDDETGPPASLTPPFDTDKQLQVLSKSSKRTESSRFVNVLIPHLSVSSGNQTARIKSAALMPKPTSAAQLSQTSETKKQLQIEGPQYSPEELSVTHSKAWDAFIFSWCNKNIVILNPHPYISMIGQFTPANFLQDFKNNTTFISGKMGATSHASVSTVDGASKQLQIEGPLYPASKATNSCSGSGPASLVTFKPPKQQLSIEIFTASNSLQDFDDISTPLSGQTRSTTHDEASIDDEAVQIISVEKNNIQPAELVEIHKATQVLLETLIRGSCIDFNPDENLTHPVSFSTANQPGIRQWCERPENRELFTPSLETLWYKPNTFNFDAIAQSDPPESISRHEPFLWNALKNFSMPTPTFIERGMHYVLAALVLIGSDAEKAHFSQELPDVSPISRGARTAYSCWHHYKKLSSLRWAKIGAKKSEAATDGCIEDLDRLIAIIYTMVETFASIWASTTLKADIEATEQLIKKSRSTKEID
ncbi:uncharacterized protein MELLADRAFT_66757 [Melampsora larici-populina 98AG31]|uniref:Uncharacterized protein n=1 Tax=Melampsora larici-populina (strain 98AG31 / pathotype 3-4-7) TaxID=747676 RepID=F4S0G1_MELLP|nr:uncharacterized protein MELLADRAFT_66757 [Melampsora larici-populina 98AG31]EGG01759.1 hypothetical protein MELLADRAFT_66757 [Melampsora larici-populina 98AG31]